MIKCDAGLGHHLFWRGPMTMVMDCFRSAGIAGLVLVAAGAAAVEAETTAPVINGNTIEGMPNARYCEIIPVVRDGAASGPRSMSACSILHRPYRETTIDRNTRSLFKAGSPVSQLEAPDGSRYVMKAYAQIVDKTLSDADLPSLSARLKPPTGWRYTTSVPAKDLIAGVLGKATVIQDELENTYQKLN
jgi:hypothetical protein